MNYWDILIIASLYSIVAGKYKHSITVISYVVISMMLMSSLHDLWTFPSNVNNDYKNILLKWIEEYTDIVHPFIN